MKKIYLISGLLLLLVFAVWLTINRSKAVSVDQTVLPGQQTEDDPLMIESMRKRSYPGSEIMIEQILDPGSNYQQYIVSYQSDGLKVYALLTVPEGEKPKEGWPVIIFNHGYIPPEVYQTTQRYTAYVDAFAKAGCIVFKPDYRGNGLSEGEPEGAYYSPAYSIDVLNALNSIKKFPQANPEKIGMWGHSLGGNITLRSLVVSSDIKAAVIWAGVVGTYDDLMNNWQRRVPYSPSPRELSQRNRRRTNIIQKYGSLEQNPKFWQSIDPNYFLSDITAPVQLHAGLSDEEVPWQFSQGLNERLKRSGRMVEFYTYEGADHNISQPSFSLAMQRSVKFFDRYLK